MSEAAAASVEKDMEKVDLDGKAVDGGENGEDEDHVDPWNVKSKDDKGIDYDKLISA